MNAVLSPIIFSIALATRFNYDKFLKTDFVPERDIVELKGKVAIVTGANSGIGFETAKFLARKGARVYLACRNETRALAALKKLKEDEMVIKNGELRYLHLDLADFESAKKAADDILAKEERLDILVNNASLLFSEKPQFIKGILDYTVVNHLCPFIFTQTLLPLLKKTSQTPDSDVRVVLVSSDAHPRVSGTIRFRDLADMNETYDSGPLHYYSRYFAYILSPDCLSHIHFTTRRIQAQERSLRPRTPAPPHSRGFRHRRDLPPPRELEHLRERHTLPSHCKCNHAAHLYDR